MTDLYAEWQMVKRLPVQRMPRVLLIVYADLLIERQRQQMRALGYGQPPQPRHAPRTAPDAVVEALEAPPWQVPPFAEALEALRRHLWRHQKCCFAAIWRQWRH